MREATIEMLKLHYKLQGEKKADRARQMLAKEIEHPCAVSVSWGKDSVACAWLCAELLTKDDYLFSVSAGQYSLPTTDQTRDAFLARYPSLQYREYKSGDYFDVAQACGLTDITSAPKGKINKAKKHSQFKIAEEGASSRVWGLRGEENAGRKLYARRYGETHRQADGLKVLSPIIYWDWRDVWSVIIANDLPYIEVYDKYDAMDGLGMGRSGTWAGTRGARMGRIVYLKHFYPGLYRKLIIQFPEVSTYA